MPSPIDLGNDGDYHHVMLGPKPLIDGLPTPAWHEQAKPSSYPFPSVEAATRFAQGHYEPGRTVIIRFPDGRQWDGMKWID